VSCTPLLSRTQQGPQPCSFSHFNIPYVVCALVCELLQSSSTDYWSGQQVYPICLYAQHNDDMYCLLLRTAHATATSHCLQLLLALFKLAELPNQFSNKATIYSTDECISTSHSTWPASFSRLTLKWHRRSVGPHELLLVVAILKLCQERHQWKGTVECF